MPAVSKMIGLLVTIAWLGYEAEIPARLARRFSKPTFSWKAPSPSLLGIVTAQTRVQLSKLTPVKRLGFESGSRAERALKTWISPGLKNFWGNNCLAVGLVISDEFYPSLENRAALEEFADRLTDQNGVFREPLRTIEQAMAGVTLLALAEKEAGGRHAKAARGLADFLVKAHPRTSTGTLPYSTEHPQTLLVDTIGIACPFLAGAGARFNNPEALDLAARQIVEFTDRAIDPATGLPWHAYEASGGPAYGILGWARGAGWYAMGLVETLRFLPREHPQRQRLISGLLQLSQALTPLQLPNGLWRWCLSQPEGQPDTSGSAMLAWALFRGVQLGVLDARSLHTAQRATMGLASETDHVGRVHQSLGECQGVGHYPRIFGSYPWGQGPATAAFVMSLAGISNAPISLPSRKTVTPAPK